MSTIRLPAPRVKLRAQAAIDRILAQRDDRWVRLNRDTNAYRRLFRWFGFKDLPLDDDFKAWWRDTSSTYEVFRYWPEFHRDEELSRLKTIRIAACSGSEYVDLTVEDYGLLA